MNGSSFCILLLLPFHQPGQKAAVLPYSSKKAL